MTPGEWLAQHDGKYGDEARALFARIRRLAPDAPVQVEGAGDAILSLGKGADGWGLIGLAVRKDGLRLYGNVREIATHREALGKRLVGKSCVRVRAADELDDELLAAIVRGSLAAERIALE